MAGMLAVGPAEPRRGGEQLRRGLEIAEEHVQKGALPVRQLTCSPFCFEFTFIGTSWKDDPSTSSDPFAKTPGKNAQTGSEARKWKPRNVWSCL